MTIDVSSHVCNNHWFQTRTKFLGNFLERIRWEIFVPFYSKPKREEGGNRVVDVGHGAIHVFNFGGKIHHHVEYVVHFGGVIGVGTEVC